MERRVEKKRQTQPNEPFKQKNIVFFHPDLGIGGAERLLVDAAVGLQNLGHKVTVFTSYRDTNHCFDEARDGTLDVRVRGGWLFPATLLGRLKILCSILRQIHLILEITWSGELARLKPTVFFLDLLSAGVPFLRWFWEDQKILFYCHFPDLLLVQGRKKLHKRIWRIGFDWIEEWGMRGAEKVIVNSGFTKGVVESVWKGIGGKTGVVVVYPCVEIKDEAGNLSGEGEGQALWKGKRILLSINRFEKKKDVGLAIRAFAGLSPQDRQGIILVLAGGYDTRVHENVVYHKDLVSLADSLKLKNATARNIVSASSISENNEVLFLLSIPAQLKSSLLEAAKILVYTPANEHFGIVPLEAMLCRTPVLAANSGGPLETVDDPGTGWLRSVDNVQQWTDVMHHVLHEMSDSQLKQMGENGKRRVREEFSNSKMALRLNEEIDAMIRAPRQEATELGDVVVSILVIGVCVLAIGAVAWAGFTTQEFHFFEVALGLAVITAACLGIGATIYRLLQNESAFR